MYDLGTVTCKVNSLDEDNKISNPSTIEIPFNYFNIIEYEAQGLLIEAYGFIEINRIESSNITDLKQLNKVRNELGFRKECTLLSTSRWARMLESYLQEFMIVNVTTPNLPYFLKAIDSSMGTYRPFIMSL